ncbi:MAG TPA: sensor histidine kinase [Thermoleophilaceae bacterium]|nr:sensor histidine kinase [Thermoleophilaceae bacterium]
MLRRLPIESTQPVVLFAVLRLALTLLALVALLTFGLPYQGEAALVVAVVLLPWSIVLLVLARRNGGLAMNTWLAAGDFVALAVLEAVVPETYGVVRFVALFLVAVHANFQGERRGLALTGFAIAVLVVPAAVQGDRPPEGAELALYESVFGVAAIASAVMVGRLRTAESASRLRARGVSRRTIQAESEVRRRVAESIHDGPVQELIGLDMVLSAARRASEGGDDHRARELIAEAHEVAERNIQALRDEIVDLGPYAFEELTFDTAIENCLPTWKRRYGFEVLVAIERVKVPPEVAGDLFRITQEAVNNAGRHAKAKAVSISLRTVDRDIELRVTDDGQGFGNGDPLAAAEPGHLGLASMRERAELLGGRLAIHTSSLGTRVLVRAPLPKAVA